MDHRFFLGTFLTFGASLAAQLPGTIPSVVPPPAGKADAPKAETAQDPDKTVVTPKQQLEQLSAERQRLEREITYVRGRAKNAKSILAEKLAEHQTTWRSIDAGTSAPKFTAPAAPKMRAARVATKEEIEGHGTNTMMLVNGRNVEQGSFDALMHYLAEAPGSTTEEQRAQRAMFELIRNEAVASSFEDHDGDEQMAAALREMDEGKTWAETAKKYGIVNGCDPEGRFEATHNSVFGTIFEQAAFRAQPGQRLRPFQNAAGIVLMQVEKIEKGATPDLDKVIGNAVQIPYSGGPEALQKALVAVTTGQVDILVRDEEVLKMLPPMFQQKAPAVTPVSPDGAPVAPAPVGVIPATLTPVQRDEMIKKLEGLQAEMTKLQGDTSDAAKQKLKELQTQYAETKAQLRGVPPVRPANPGPQDKTPQAPQKKS